MHPMMRHLTDAAPQEGERAFRSGLVLPTAETAAERGMRSAAEREMGDLNEAGDAPFGGEVAVDSQVALCRFSPHYAAAWLHRRGHNMHLCCPQLCHRLLGDFSPWL